MTKIYALIWLSCAMLVFLSCNTGETAKKAEPVVTLNAADQQLLTNAYLKTLLGLKIAEEATTRSAAIETKELAEIINRDHRKILQELETVAGRNNVTLPLDISEDQVKQWQEVVRERGLAFDKKFATVVQREHEQMLEVFRKLQSASNKDLQAAAANFLSVAKEHKHQGEMLETNLNNKRSRETDTTIVEELSKN